jgi:hypothetical protein
MSKEYKHTKQDIDFLIETASGYSYDQEIYTDFIKDILLIMNERLHELKEALNESQN